MQRKSEEKKPMDKKKGSTTLSLHRLYHRIKFSIGDNLLSVNAMAIAVAALKAHAAKKGLTFNCAALEAKDNKLEELETFLTILEKNKQTYPNNTQFQYVINYNPDSQDNYVLPHWTTANIHIVDGKIKFYLLDAASLNHGFYVQLAMIDKYCPDAEVTCTHLKIQEDNENCGYFSLDLAMALNKIPNLSAKLDPLCGCDVYLMLPPGSGENLVSDENHLYLYQDKKHKGYFYRYKIDDVTYDFPLPHIPSLSLSNHMFIERANAPRRCENKELCKEILRVTASRNHTLTYSTDWKKNYYKELDSKEGYFNLTHDENGHLWNALRKLKCIPKSALLTQPGFGSLFKNTQLALDTTNVTCRKGQLLSDYISAHSKQPTYKDDSTIENFAVNDKAKKTKKRSKEYLKAVDETRCRQIIEQRQGVGFFANCIVASEEKHPACDDKAKASKIFK